MLIRCTGLLFFLLTLALAAQAYVVKQYFHVQSGTGFFVSDDGYLLTNEHVVRGCSKVIVKGPAFSQTEADVRATDTAHDLALIHTPTRPGGTAYLRDNIEALKPGDGVVVIGYPGDAWRTGAYKISDAALVNTHGPGDHPEWIEFSDSIARGNSGGPLVDRSGNVIGIVVAILFQEKSLYRVNAASGEKTLVQTTNTKSDGAIGLATAEDFLRQQGVDYHVSLSGPEAGDAGIEETVKRFIVNVQCRTQISEAEAQATPGNMEEIPAQ